VSPWHGAEEFKSASCRGGRAATSRRSAITSGSRCCRPRRASAARYRVYDTADIRRLAFIRRARELGFTLDTVRALLALSENDGQSACAEVRDLAAGHLAEVRAKITDLRAMGRVLADAVRRCADGDLPGCPVIDALSAA
jgi:MerR family mercuric resistance operon transcriptional regulator